MVVYHCINTDGQRINKNKQLLPPPQNYSVELNHFKFINIPTKSFLHRCTFLTFDDINGPDDPECKTLTKTVVNNKNKNPLIIIIYLNFIHLHQMSSMV